jgi:ferric-dicitrate binding protein FerR (iron transport regulator)
MSQTTPPSTSSASQAKTRAEPVLEVFVAILLAVAAICTAWSGYQARLWSGMQSIYMSQAGARRTESVRATTQADQLTLLDMLMYNEWIKAYAAGQEDLQRFYERRFRAELRPAFEAWLATDPANNPDAPTGPFVMPEYQVSKAEEAIALEEEAAELFNKGREANEISENYILITVFMALVLVFSGFAPRFKWLPVRIAVVVIAFMFLIFGLINIAGLPIR